MQIHLILHHGVEAVTKLYIYPWFPSSPNGCFYIRSNCPERLHFTVCSPLSMCYVQSSKSNIGPKSTI